jgi:signal transduction histidine kinase
MKRDTMKFSAFLAAFMLLISASFTAHAEDRGTRDEAIAMTNDVVKMYKESGEEATFKAITAKQFKNKDLYPFVYSFEGIVLAHGQKENMVGLNRWDAMDQLVGGKKYIQEFVALAKTGAAGWVSYKFIDPLTKSVMDEESYVVPLNDKALVGVGIYK